MRLANLDGRAVLVAGGTTALDVATASEGRFGPGLPALYDEWDAFRRWVLDQDLSQAGGPVDRARLGSPSPAPRQVFAIGLNYRDHARESGLAVPDGLPAWTHSSESPHELRLKGSP